MKTLIVYATKYGGTQICAERLSQKLPGSTECIALSKKTLLDLEPYDTVIVGCSVYMGKPLKEAMAFCERHQDALLERRLGLFLCCIQDLDKTVKQQMALAFPRHLQEHASALGVLGGIVDYTKLSRRDGFIMRLVAGDLQKKTGKSVLSTVSDERISRFVSLLTEKKPGS